MARNKLNDLNDHLFEMLERLNDDELDEGKLDIELQRAKGVTMVGKQIIENAKVQLEAIKTASLEPGDDYKQEAIKRLTS